MNNYLPNETASSLFNRKKQKNFHITIPYQQNQYHNDIIHLNQFVEIQCPNPNHVPLAVIDIMLQYATQFQHDENSIIIHVSISNTLLTTIKQSSYDIHKSQLTIYHYSNRLKAMIVKSLSELMILIESMYYDSNKHTSLLIMENISSIFLENKLVCSNATGGITIEKVLSRLKDCSNVIPIFCCAGMYLC